MLQKGSPDWHFTGSGQFEMLISLKQGIGRGQTYMNRHKKVYNTIILKKFTVPMMRMESPILPNIYFAGVVHGQWPIVHHFPHLYIVV